MKVPTAVVLEFVHNPEKHFIAFLIRIQLPSQPTSELAVKCNASSPQCKSKPSLADNVP